MTQKPDPRTSGIPEAGNLQARLSSSGDLEQVTVRVKTPNGDVNDSLLARFKLEDGVATLDKVTKRERGGGEKDLGTLWVSSHLPGILAAEMAVDDLEQVRDVRGMESLLAEARTQAEYGHQLRCQDCGEDVWAAQALNKTSDGLQGGCYCPECEGKLVPPYQAEA